MSGWGGLLSGWWDVVGCGGMWWDVVGGGGGGGGVQVRVCVVLVTHWSIACLHVVCTSPFGAAAAIAMRVGSAQRCDGRTRLRSDVCWQTMSTADERMRVRLQM